MTKCSNEYIYHETEKPISKTDSQDFVEKAYCEGDMVNADYLIDTIIYNQPFQKAYDMHYFTYREFDILKMNTFEVKECMSILHEAVQLGEYFTEKDSEDFYNDYEEVLSVVSSL